MNNDNVFELVVVSKNLRCINTFALIFTMKTFFIKTKPLTEIHISYRALVDVLVKKLSFCTLSCVRDFCCCELITKLFPIIDTFSEK